MRELVILKRCDECSAEATDSYVVGVTTGEAAPRLFLADLCEIHAGPFQAMAAQIQDYAPFQNGKAAPAPNRTTHHTKADPCEICGREYSSRGTLVAHVWREHCDSRRPVTPDVCPDCGVEFPSTSMGVHRSASHGYSALAEAYEAAS